MSEPVDQRMPGRVLIADDDEFFRLAAATILRQRLQVSDITETASLDEALVRLSEAGDRPFALALFDLHMPGMESAASLSAVRECFPQVRTALVSASRRREDILLALAAGAHGYIWKASGAGELERSLRAILAGEVVVPAWLAEINAQTIIPRAQSAPQFAPLTPVQLTPRQIEVLKYLVAGSSNKEIARALSLGEGTVKVHVAALLRALNVPNRAAAAVAGAAIIAHMSAY